MNPKAVVNVLGKLLMVIGCSMLLPLMVSLYYQEGDWPSLLVSALLSIAAGFPAWRLYRKESGLQLKDGFILAVFGWILISAVSTLPFMIHGSIPSFTDAFFEMMSGYTTTGATILEDIESVPHGLLFWRSQTHLLGGMGFLTLTIIFMPHGMAGLRVFRAESSPGQVITREKFKARNKDTMIWLWGIYLGLNILLVLLLFMGGMSLFDSLCHAFGTVSTSGYSPKNASLGFYNNAYFDWVTIIFMFLGGISFLLLYHLIRGDFKALGINTEFKWYCGFLLFFGLTVSCILWIHGTYPGFKESLRYAAFQVTSLLTTTGFTTADYETWPQAAQMFLYAVCFIGACAGSTTSGIKTVHYVLIGKYMLATVRKLFFQPMAVISVRLNRRPVEHSIIDIAICYFIVNIFMVFGGACFMVLVDDMSYASAMSSVIASLMNIGPGFAAVGPSENYAFISGIGKWFLSWNMLVGRLEMFSALVILYPSFWKK